MAHSESGQPRHFVRRHDEGLAAMVHFENESVSHSKIFSRNPEYGRILFAASPVVMTGQHLGMVPIFLERLEHVAIVLVMKDGHDSGLDGLQELPAPIEGADFVAEQIAVLVHGFCLAVRCKSVTV